jgi:hypothetical protein
MNAKDEFPDNIDDKLMRKRRKNETIFEKTGDFTTA